MKASPSSTSAPDHACKGVSHYENFPVATWLCPKRLRPAVAAIYHFARCADDIADEGQAPAAQRLADLARYRDALGCACCTTQPLPPDLPWPQIFAPLQAAIARHALPVQPLHHLLDAFAQDIAHSARAQVYASHADLLDYARLSANPVGRLMLHLYGVHDASALQSSDAICSALQLFNFWQDLSVDVPRGRYYLPQDLCRACGVDPRAPAQAAPAAMQTLLDALLQRAFALMHAGNHLPAQVARTAGRMAAWELQLVRLGGLRIGQKTASLGARIVHTRPSLHAGDALRMLLRMGFAR